MAIALLQRQAAPPWAMRFALDIEKTFLPLFPSKPVRLVSYLRADLPNAADWTGCIVYVSDLKKIAASDGTNWLDALGAPL